MTQTEHDIDAWLHSLPRTEESRRLVTEWLQSPDVSEDEETWHSEDQTQESTGSTAEFGGPLQSKDGLTVLRDGPTNPGKRHNHPSPRLVMTLVTSTYDVSEPQGQSHLPQNESHRALTRHLLWRSRKEPSGPHLTWQSTWGTTSHAASQRRSGMLSSNSTHDQMWPAAFHPRWINSY